MTEVDELPEIPSLEDKPEIDVGEDDTIEDHVQSPVKSVPKPLQQLQPAEEVEEQIQPPTTEIVTKPLERADSPTAEVIEDELAVVDSVSSFVLVETAHEAHDDIFEIFDQDHPKSARKADIEVVVTPGKKVSNPSSVSNSPSSSAKKKMVVKSVSSSPQRRRLDDDDLRTSPVVPELQIPSTEDIIVTSSDIAQEAIISARDSLDRKKEDVPESHSSSASPPEANTQPQPHPPAEANQTTTTPSPAKKKKPLTTSPLKEVQLHKEKEAMAEEAEKLAVQAKQSRLNAQRELKEHRAQQRKQQLSNAGKEKKDNEDEQSKDKDPTREKRSGIPRRKSSAAVSEALPPNETPEDDPNKLPAISAKSAATSAQRLLNKVTSSRSKADPNKSSLPVNRRSAEKLPKLVQMSKDDSHEEDNGEERGRQDHDELGKRPPRSSPEGGGESVGRKKKKPLYLRMIAKAQKKIVEEERKKHEEYMKSKQSRANHVPTREELKEHRVKFDEMLKQKAEEQHRNHVNNIRALRKARHMNEDGSVADSESATPLSSPQKSLQTPQKDTGAGSPLKKRHFQTPKNELLTPNQKSPNNDDGEIPHMDNFINKSFDGADSVVASEIQVVGQSSKKSPRSPRGLNSPRIAKIRSHDANDTSMEKGPDSEPTSPKLSPRSARSAHKSPSSKKSKKMPSRRSLELTDDDDEDGLTSPEAKKGSKQKQKEKEKFNFTIKDTDVSSMCPDDWLHRMLASSLSVDDIHGEAPLLD